MGAKSKKKGNCGELALAKILSAHLGGSFVRSNASGAFVGGKNSFRKTVLSENQIQNTRGDICPPDNFKHLVIESKVYAVFRYHQIFDSCPVLDAWLAQAKSAADTNDFWILGFKSNRIPWLIAFDANLLDNFVLSNYSIYRNDTGKYVITDLETYLEKNKSEITRLSENGTKTI